jgi:hypothetical protein
MEERPELHFRDHHSYYDDPTMIVPDWRKKNGNEKIMTHSKEAQIEKGKVKDSI